MIIVFAGFSGSGKTYFAKKLKEKLNCEYLNSDVIRKKLAHLNPTTHVYENFGKGLYSPQMTKLTYEYMLKKAKEILKKEKFVIIDATFISPVTQKMLIDSRLNYIFIWCYASDEIIKYRLEKRKTDKKNVSDANWEIYLNQKKNFKGLIIPEDRIIKFNTESENISRIEEIIKNDN